MLTSDNEEKTIAHKETGAKLKRSLIRNLHILTHPLRFGIIETLRDSGEQLFIQQIADQLRTDHKLVSFHLTILSQHGFVEGEWRTSVMPRSRGKAVKCYKLTPKVEQVLSRFPELSQAQSGQKLPSFPPSV
jgi:predicted ArsR family transcriptional regulator